MAFIKSLQWQKGNIYSHISHCRIYTDSIPVAKEGKPFLGSLQSPNFHLMELYCNVFISSKREDGSWLELQVSHYIVFIIYRAEEDLIQIHRLELLSGRPSATSLCRYIVFVLVLGLQEWLSARKNENAYGTVNVPAFHGFQPFYGQNWCPWTFSKPRASFSELAPSLCLIELESGLLKDYLTGPPNYMQ